MSKAPKRVTETKLNNLCKKLSDSQDKYNYYVVPVPKGVRVQIHINAVGTLAPNEPQFEMLPQEEKPKIEIVG